MLFEIIGHLLALDLPYFINLVSSNPIFFFGIFVAAFLLSDKKIDMKAGILVFIFIWFNIFAELQFMGAFGWVLLSAEFFALILITRFAVLAFTESIPTMKKHFNAIYMLHFWLLYMIFNVFILGR